MAFSGKAHSFTNTAICGDHLKNDIEGGKSQRTGLVIAGLGDSDEKNCETKPPHVVVELGTKLLVHKPSPSKLRETCIAGFSRVVKVMLVR